MIARLGRGGPLAAVGRVVTFLVVIGLLSGLGYGGYWLYSNMKSSPAIEVTYNQTGSSDTDKPYFAPVNVQVKDIPSEVTQGEKTTISINAGKSATCSVLVADSNSQKDRGLHTKKADSKGDIVWQWDVPSTARLGYWPIEINCKNPQHSAQPVKRTIQVVKPEKD